MQERNQKIINAIIDKANRDCPGSLALIGIYGSFLTGDVHEKSDLDLLILINDEKGYSLARTFIQEDEQVGHDLYCTTWEMLEFDAKFTHPHIAKLMDSKIVYCADEAYRNRLEALRKQAMEADTQEAAKSALRDAESCFAKAILAEDFSDIRVQAGEMIYKLLDAVALLNGTYFRLGTRRVFSEIAAMPRRPENFRAFVEAIPSAKTAAELKGALGAPLLAVEKLFEAPLSRSQPFPGTYEEMFSNWRNKLYLAAKIQEPYLSFDSMCALDSMLRDLGYDWNVLDRFNGSDLKASAGACDAILEAYRKEYDNAGIPVQSYPNVDAFIEDYLKKQA